MKKLLIITIAIIGIVFANSSNAKADINHSIDLPRNACAAKSIIGVIIDLMNGSGSSDIGGECSITCPDGTKADCKTGLFSAHCSCITLEQPNTPGFVIPSGITEEMIELANDFASLCNGSNSTNLYQLGTISLNIINAVNNNNNSDYNLYENQFMQLFAELSSSEIAIIENWETSH